MKKGCWLSPAIIVTTGPRIERWSWGTDNKDSSVSNRFGEQQLSLMDTTFILSIMKAGMVHNIEGITTDSD